MGKGFLACEIHTADDAMPVEGARVIIRDEDDNILFEDISDRDGNTRIFEVEAPDKSLTLQKDYEGRPYGVCNVDIIKEGYNTLHVRGVEIVDSITSILPTNLHPEEVDVDPDEYIIIPEAGPRLPTDQRQVGANPFALREVVVPEYITVHLGAPTNAGARNVRVKFPDYIKNVASSEIYPTWPNNSLLANIHVITTFALNRVYTEWYPSRGFNFDITNSTAYDQYFVEGRNIFQNISQIVDEIFNVYARRYAFANPFFTQYCNGTTSTCQGLSQWGTVDLANRGYTPIQILHYFYPNDLELVQSNNIQAIQESYPGYALREGMSGTNVLRIQNFLNRIRVNYPLIPQINPDGFFGPETTAAVRTFQRTFNMTVDGIVGRATWNKITFIYVGVIRLGELDSEGIRIGVGRTPPAATVRLNSTGENVTLLQFMLNAISPYHTSIPFVIQDGLFGNDTKNAVIEFQKTFGLAQDGIVGPATWNKLYGIYWGIQDNSPVPPAPPVQPEIAPPFPGTLLRLNSTGSDVRLMQTYLNTIRTVYPSIPPVVADAIFGPATLAAVTAFQRQFLLTPDGIIGPITWDKIVEQFLLVTGNATVSTVFPGTPLSVGSQGSDVRLMQTFLTELRTIYPSIPFLTVDGIFGPQTRAAVVAFQNQFGLTPDGIIGPVTWNSIVARRNEHFGR